MMAHEPVCMVIAVLTGFIALTAVTETTYA